MKKQMSKLTAIFVLFFSSALYAKQAVEVDLFPKQTKKIRAILAKSEVSEVKHYCTKGKMNCRSMYKLKDKVTGAAVPLYYDTFYSADRQTGSTCYVVASNGGAKFNQYSDLAFDSEVNINWKSPLAPKVEVDLATNTYRFLNMKFPKLNTTQYILGSMIQTDQKVVLSGVEYNENEPTYQVPVPGIEYLRVNP